MAKLSALLILACFIVGCGTKPPPGLKQAKIGEPASFVGTTKLTILEPVDHGTVKRGDPIHCKVLIPLSKDGKLPGFPKVNLLRGRLLCSSAFLEPKRKTKDGYECEATLQAMNTPGRYTLRAVAEEIVEPSLSTSANEATGIESGSASIEIEVQ